MTRPDRGGEGDQWGGKGQCSMLETQQPRAPFAAARPRSISEFPRAAGWGGTRHCGRGPLYVAAIDLRYTCSSAPGKFPRSMCVFSGTHLAVKREETSRVLNYKCTRPSNSTYISRCVNVYSRLHWRSVARRTCQLRHASIICTHVIVRAIVPRERDAKNTLKWCQRAFCGSGARVSSRSCWLVLARSTSSPRFRARNLPLS